MSYPKQAPYNNGANAPPPPYGFQAPPPAAPPSYSQAMGGVPPTSPFTAAKSPFPQQQTSPPIVTTVVPVGPHSTHTVCPTCGAEIDTATTTEPGIIAYVSGVVIALLGCWLGCCLIPCCIDECMDVHHKCPNCKTYLGRYRR
ncbi:cell death-inducing p53-target protein 1 isoform X2 [Ctenocephalides felis]|nr:cell death-inducing p53-target protein 1 isoform X2 [Ctenocephalides felis]